MDWARYRLYLDGTPATSAQLANFEDITIEQEMDKASEARFEVPICTDDRGLWDGETEAFVQGMNRIRLEVQVAAGAWVPLIDGPVVAIEGKRHSEPGLSVLTLVVSDDSFWLHRDERVKSFEDSDDRIAAQLFDGVPQIASTDIDAAPAASGAGFDTTVMRGTPMESLRVLARRQHMHAWVACGPTPGTSIGCFKLDPDPGKDYGLAPMLLLGTGMNIFSFEGETRVGQTAIFRSRQVKLTDRSTDDATARQDDIALQGTQGPPGPTLARLLRPAQADALTLQRAVQGASERAAYALSAHGEVMKETYPSVLQPYQFVDVLGADGTTSGRWLIRQVTHTLTRNEYGQSFKVARNARSAGTNSPAPQVPAAVF